ncbi:type III secretion system inner membrane ring subunit SctD, partial [Yersinia bercovieri]|uniref:type III secretion system inner membrane ring subunit SctD n=1 Tax=Yersinia bercovieri TaxID=634 RepID=UPI0011A7DAA2
MTVSYKLRLLNGELKGRELRLPEGKFTLGEQGCDVLLPLPQGEILTLVISEHQIMMQVAGEVWVNGFRHNLQQALPLKQAIETSGLILVLGEENDVLSGVKITPRAGAHLLLWLSVVTLILLSLLLILIFWVMQQPKELQAYFTPDMPTQLSEQLKKPALQGVKGSWLSDGSVMLSGHCTSSSAIINLQNFLVLNHIVFQNQLVCDDHLITSINDVLHQYGYQDVEVKIGEKSGDIILHGSIEMGAQWLDVQKALASVAGLKSWKVVNTHDGQISLLVERLKKLGLLGYL